MARSGGRRTHLALRAPVCLLASLSVVVVTGAAVTGTTATGAAATGATAA